MARRRNNSNYTRGRFVGNQSVHVDNVPKIQSHDMRNPINYDAREMSVNSARSSAVTPYQQIRDYDLRLDDIDVNLVGAAPIYGQLNQSQSWAFAGNSALGRFTGDIFNKYTQDKFFLLAAVHRNVIMHYKGLDFGQSITSWDNNGFGISDTLQGSLAFDVLAEGTSQLIFELNQARYTDLQFLNIQYADFTASQKPDIVNVLDPRACALMQYQHEVQLYIMLVATFNLLRAYITQLQFFDFKNRPSYEEIEQRLKTARFTIPIKTIMTALKHRFVDINWLRNNVLALIAPSKSTDGLNSPIQYLTLGLETPVYSLKFADSSQGVKYRIPNLFSVDFNKALDKKRVTVPANGIVKRIMNAFQFDNIFQTLWNPQQAGNLNTVDALLDSYLQMLENAQKRIIEFSTNPMVSAVETALAKLATQPRGIQWKQNVDIAEGFTFNKFVDWQAVNALVHFSATRPNFGTTNDPDYNGYSLTVPMYQYAGIDRQLQYESFQFAYLPSDRNSVGLFEVEDIVEYRFKDGSYAKVLVEEGANKVTWTVNQRDFVKAPGSTTEIQDYVSRLMQEDIPLIKYNATSGVNQTYYITNPHLIAWVNARYTNLAGEMVMELRRNFLIPLA